MPQILHYLGVEKHTKVSITDEVASQTPASSEQSAETTPVKKTGVIENHKEDVRHVFIQSFQLCILWLVLLGSRLGYSGHLHLHRQLPYLFSRGRQRSGCFRFKVLHYSATDFTLPFRIHQSSASA